MSSAAIELMGLRFCYPDGREALRGLDLRIEPGESVALIGPNGAGKSTLLLHLNGLLPARGGGPESDLGAGHGHGLPRLRTERGQSAMVRIHGLDVNRKNLRRVRRVVGLLFQDPDDQLFSPTVLEDVAFGPLNLGMRAEEAERVARACLERVDLSEAAERPPHHLSYGERKRASLAGVLACSPSILALDEPTANLDPRGRRRFMSLIGSLQATKLIATHDLEMALELCPRAVLLDGGRIVADDATRVLLANAELMEAHGLEVPLSLALEGSARPHGEHA